jgi:hypothetical protein
MAPKADPSMAAGRLHNELVSAARDEVLSLSTLPGIMVGMLRAGSWRHLVRPIDGRAFENEAIEDWILGEPWPGLHFPDWAHVYGLLSRSIPTGQECIDLLIEAGAPDVAAVETDFRIRKDEATQRGPGGDHRTNVDNVHGVERPAGNAAAAALRRLRKDRPDLLAKVKAGELSANAAAIEAGFRVKTITVPVDVDRAARALVKVFTPSQREKLSRLLLA